jgi:hypothetical protein
MTYADEVAHRRVEWHERDEYGEDGWWVATGERVFTANPLGVIILIEDEQRTRKRLIPWHKIESLTFFGQDDIIDRALGKERQW